LQRRPIQRDFTRNIKTDRNPGNPEGNQPPMDLLPELFQLLLQKAGHFGIEVHGGISTANAVVRPSKINPV
jgi:hypothetical protein